MDSTLIIAVVCGTLLLLAGAAFAINFVAHRPTARFKKEFFEYSTNQAFLAGMRALQDEWKLVATDSLTKMTERDIRKLKQTLGQLHGPQEEIFPLFRWLGERLAEPLPLACLYKLRDCPVLIHPLTWTVFAIRIGTYLCLLRLPDAVRSKAIAEGAVWTRFPTAPLKEIDLADRFGEEWVVPNTLHPGIKAFYVQAMQHAGQLEPDKRAQ